MSEFYRTNQIMTHIYNRYWEHKNDMAQDQLPLIKIQLSCEGQKTNHLNIDIQELIDIIEVLNKKEVIEHEK